MVSKLAAGTTEDNTLPGSRSNARLHVNRQKKPARRVNEIGINQDQRLALQRDIDQESQPREPARPLVAQGMVTLDMLADNIKEVDEQRGRDPLVKKRKRGKNKGVDESLKMAKKDKKKTKIETNKDGSPDGEKKTTKKKKNKKPLEENGGDDVSQRSLTQEEPSGKKQKKLKKTSDKSVQSKAAGCFKTEEEEEAQATKKKKSKKVMVENQSEVINIDESEDDKDVVEMITTTTKKNKAGPKTSVTKTVAGQEESQGVHHKAKKRKAHLETAAEIEIVEIVTKKKGKKEETKPTKTKKAKSSAVVDEESTKRKSRRKKTKSEISSKVEGDQEVSMVDDKEQKRKKKNAKIDIQAPVRDMAQNTEKFVFVACDAKGKGKKQMKGALGKIKIKAKTEEVEVHVDKKRRKKKIKLEEDAPEMEPTPEVTPHTDVVFLSEKTGNRDEVTINQERRLALQMDIDKESRPQTPAKPPGFGQWGTARFDSTEKQQKFLRLMGGFKKETQTSGPSAARPNMALAQDQQQNLHQALLGEFERAQSRRLDFSGRGAGLGFSAPPSKKFSIDANATRSVRFDD